MFQQKKTIMYLSALILNVNITQMLKRQYRENTKNINAKIINKTI